MADCPLHLTPKVFAIPNCRTATFRNSFFWLLFIFGTLSLITFAPLLPSVFSMVGCLGIYLTLKTIRPEAIFHSESRCSIGVAPSSSLCVLRCPPCARILIVLSIVFIYLLFFTLFLKTFHHCYYTIFFFLYFIVSYCILTFVFRILIFVIKYDHGLKIYINQSITW